MRTIAFLLTVTASASSAMADTLVDTAQLVNYPGQGYQGYDASAVELHALGKEHIYGYGCSTVNGWRMCDDFEVTGLGWNVEQIVVYAYVGNSGTGSPFTGVTMQIWDGVPGDVGSSVIFGDTVTNRMTNTIWSEIYRCYDGNLLDNRRPIMENTVQIGTILDPGTYWFDFACSAPFGNPMGPPVTILGIPYPPGANGMRTADGGVTYYQLLDESGPDAVPFKVLGVELGTLGDLNCDGVLNAFDIDPFVLALTDPAGYAAAWPNCDRMLADINGDGVVNAFDIDPFVDLIVP